MSTFTMIGKAEDPTWTKPSRNSASWTSPTRTLTPGDRLLLESGDYLLLETSDKILLTDSTALSWTSLNKS